MTARPHVSVFQALTFILKNRSLKYWSFALMAGMALLSYSIFHLLSVYVIDPHLVSWSTEHTAAAGVLGWIKHQSISIGGWIVKILTSLLALYLSIQLSYAFMSSAYSFLSDAAEDIYLVNPVEDQPFSITAILKDTAEGLKFSAFSIVLIGIAFLLNFIPLLGPALVFIMYATFMSTMFLDAVMSRRLMNAKEKLRWIQSNKLLALRIGIIPMLVSLIPIGGIFVLSFIFPVMIVYATLNFARVEESTQN